MRVVILALSQSAHCEARTDGFEVPKFSFDIFLKNNPTRNLLGVATKLDLDGFETHAVSDNINNIMDVDPPDIFDAHAEARCKGTRRVATNP